MIVTYGEQLITYLAKLNLELNLPFLRRITTPTSTRKLLMHSFKTVSIEDVITAVRASPRKQCASDPLPTWLLKEVIIILAPYITTIFNSSITRDIVSGYKGTLVLCRYWRKLGCTILLLQTIIRFKIFHSFRKSSKGLSTVNLSVTSTRFTCFQMLIRHTYDVT